MSLLEMLLVLMLIAVASSLALMVTFRSSEGSELREAAAVLSAQLRHARVQAIMNGEPTYFYVQPSTRQWYGPNGRTGTLPETLRLRFTGAAQLVDGGRAAIAFHPDGGSSGGRIELYGERSAWRLEVNWVTGQVQGQALGGRQ